MMVTASERALAELSFRLVRLLGGSKTASIVPAIDTEAGTLLASAILREALTANEPKSYLPLFAPEVVFSSPQRSEIVRSRTTLAEYLRELFAPLWDLEFQQTFIAERGSVMRFNACVRGTHTDGLLLSQFDDQGRIREFILTINAPIARLLPATN